MKRMGLSLLVALCLAAVAAVADIGPPIDKTGIRNGKAEFFTSIPGWMLSSRTIAKCTTPMTTDAVNIGAIDITTSAMAQPATRGATVVVASNNDTLNGTAPPTTGLVSTGAAAIDYSNATMTKASGKVTATATATSEVTHPLKCPIFFGTINSGQGTISGHGANNAAKYRAVFDAGDRASGGGTVLGAAVENGRALLDTGANNDMATGTTGICSSA